MAEYENRLREAANALAKKQLGLDPKTNKEEKNDKLPEIFLSVEGQYLISLNESFRKLCGTIRETYKLNELSDNSLLILANKVNERAINGKLESIGDLSQDSEISSILEYVSVVQNEEEVINAKYDDEFYENNGINENLENSKTIMGMDSKELTVLAAFVMANTINDDLKKFDDAITFDEKAEAAESLRAAQYMEKIKNFRDKNGKVEQVAELPLLAGLWNLVITHKDSMSLEELKALALETLIDMDEEKYGEFLDKIESVTAKDDLDTLIGDEFYNVRKERNPRTRETREQLDEKMHNLSRYRSIENKQQIIDKAENLRGLSIEEIARIERQKAEEIARRKIIAQKYSEAMKEISSGKPSFDKLQESISEAKDAGFSVMYKAMLGRVKDKSIKDNNIGLASVYTELSANDKEENSFVQVETMDIGNEDKQLGEER